MLYEKATGPPTRAEDAEPRGGELEGVGLEVPRNLPAVKPLLADVHPRHLRNTPTKHPHCQTADKR
eukprot:1196271-Prorocentrum_minimum.AAC.4